MSVRIICGDVMDGLRQLADESVGCCVTSPPYWGLRDYGVAGQLGLEKTPEEYVAKMVEVFREVRRVLRDDGTLWLNLGDSYAGGGNYRGVHSEDTLTSKQSSNRGARGLSQQLGSAGKDFGIAAKNLVGIPWRVAFALQSDGWYLRSDIIWHKPNPMPESVTDRPTKAHEYVFLLSKSARYYYDGDAIAEPVAPSQVGRVRSDPVGGASREGRQQHSAGGVYSTAKWDAEEPQSSGRRMVENTRAARARGGQHDAPFGDTRNARSVWTIATQPFPEAHFATFPEELPARCVKAGCPAGGTVLDPFGGAGTTGLVAARLGRNAVLIELNPKYVEMTRARLDRECPLLAEVV